MVERDLAKVEVAGSKPVSRSTSSLRGSDREVLKISMRLTFLVAQTPTRAI